MKYVDLIIDNKSDMTDRVYTYGCRLEDVKVGSKVYVHFAKGKKERTAYVVAIRDTLEQEFSNLKYVLSVDPDVVLSPEIMETCGWMQRRYLCRFIDAIHLFAPSGGPSKRRKVRNPLDEIDADKELPHEEANRKLTIEQQQTLEEMQKAAKEKQRLFLLHGITGSGKTEVYMRLIKDCVDSGKTAIMMVPEISLTKQIIERFARRFSHEVLAVLHSGLTKGQRYDEWQRIKTGQVRIVVGARSAVFAPVEDIGLIILDEEHEATYKSDMAPKYETLEVAIKRAGNYNGIVLCGSATPSVVTYARSQKGIFKYLSMTKRYNQVPLPTVDVVDMRQELAAGNTSIVSRQLYTEMRKQLAEGRQVILLLNRRGYYNYTSCPSCGYVVRCPQCGITMTYHKEQQQCVCHYCGRRQPVPTLCPECGMEHMRFTGKGTEQVEETISELFPEYPADRLDLDTMKKRGALKKILKAFEKGKTKILLGTQVVAKGLDFPNVGLVGILSADVSLNLPDYRSPERTFQLVTQAAGRAGRGSEQGKVILQTADPEHYAIVAAAKQDYQLFYRQEIQIRKLLLYPPYTDLIQCTIWGKKEEVVVSGANYWHQTLLSMMGEKEASFITSPQKMELFVEQDISRYYILIKCKQGMRPLYMGALKKIKEETLQEKNYGVTVDVNPYNLGRN